MRAWRAYWAGPAMILMLVAGCRMGPNYHRPDVHAPPVFRGGGGMVTNSAAEMPWWRLFQDPVLQQLIRTALTNNFNARLAYARVEEARAVFAQARSEIYPTVGYSGGVSAGTNAVNGTPFLGAEGKFSDAAITASWEIDLWGRLRRYDEATRAQFLSTQEAQRNVRITLISEVAQAYFQLLALDQQLAIAEESTNSFGETLKIFREQLHGGIASRLETSAAEAAEAAQAATIPELRRQIILQENQLSVLLGENPGPITRRPGALVTELLPEIPPGLPSDLLRRRPDIRQAEQTLREANASIGVAQAEFYPDISLTGMLGAVSPQLNLFASGAATAWNAAGSLAGPIFEGGRLRAQLRQARAQWEEALFEFRATVLNAFQEVSNALTSRDQWLRERAEQEREVSAYKDAVEVARQRFVAGQSSYYELLQEQQQLYPAENALTQTRANILLATVQLYIALGGGWEPAGK